VISILPVDTVMVVTQYPDCSNRYWDSILAEEAAQMCWMLPRYFKLYCL